MCAQANKMGNRCQHDEDDCGASSDASNDSDDGVGGWAAAAADAAALILATVAGLTATLAQFARLH